MAESSSVPAWLDWKAASGTTILAGVILANIQGFWVSGTTYQEKVAEVKELKEKCEKYQDLLLKTLQVAESRPAPVFGQSFSRLSENSVLEEVKAEMRTLDKKNSAD